MSSSSHRTECANAVVTTPDECKCKCAGGFHGGPNTHRARALLWDEGKRKDYSKQQVRISKSKARAELAQASASNIPASCTDFIGFSVIDCLIRMDTGRIDQDRAKEAIVAVVVPFIESLSGSSLSRAEKKHLQEYVVKWHILCSLCVEILKVFENLEETDNELINSITGKVWSSLADTGATIDDLEDGLKSAVDDAVEETAISLVRHLSGAEDLKKMVQLLGLITCPNIDQHHEVNQYCLEPLESFWVSQALIQWVRQGFPQNDPVLAGRSR